MTIKIHVKRFNIQNSDVNKKENKEIYFYFIFLFDYIDIQKFVQVYWR